MGVFRNVYTASTRRLHGVYTMNTNELFHASSIRKSPQQYVGVLSINGPLHTYHKEVLGHLDLQGASRV